MSERIFFTESGDGLSHVMRKHVFTSCDQVRHKPACSATEASKSLRILDIASVNIILSREQRTKMLIRLHGCPGLSVYLLFAYGTNRFCHGAAYLFNLWSFRG